MVRNILCGTLLILSSLATVAQAGDFVCTDAGGTTLRQYLHSRDPSTVTDPLCTGIPKAQTATQWALVQSPLGQCQWQGSFCYLKVESGLVVEKTQAEKDAVDAAMAAAAAARQVYRDEVQTQEYCATVTLDELTAKVTTVKTGISARLTPSITNATTIPLLRQALADTAHELETVLDVSDKIARCVIALRVAPR